LGSGSITHLSDFVRAPEGAGSAIYRDARSDANAVAANQSIMEFG